MKKGVGTDEYIPLSAQALEGITECLHRLIYLIKSGLGLLETVRCYLEGALTARALYCLVRPKSPGVSLGLRPALRTGEDEEDVSVSSE